MKYPLAVSWAIVSCLGYGCGTYIVDYMNGFKDEDFTKIPDFSPWYKMGLVWVSNLLVCVPVLCGMSYGRRPYFCEGAHFVGKLLAVLAGLAAGLFNGTALVCTLNAFKYDPINAGPLAALMTSDVALYAVIGHFFLGERLVPKQWIAMVLLMVGLGCLAFAGSKGESSPSNTGVDPVLALVYALGATFSYLGNNLAIQASAKGGLTNDAAFVVRTASIGTTGLLLIAHFHYKYHPGGFAFVVATTTFYNFLPVVCGLAEILATYALGNAFMHPNSSVMASIIGSNPVVVLVLGIAIAGKLPSLLPLLGMLFAVSSSYALVVLASDAQFTARLLEPHIRAAREPIYVSSFPQARGSVSLRAWPDKAQSWHAGLP